MAAGDLFLRWPKTFALQFFAKGDVDEFVNVPEFKATHAPFNGLAEMLADRNNASFLFGRLLKGAGSDGIENGVNRSNQCGDGIGIEYFAANADAAVNRRLLNDGILPSLQTRPGFDEAKRRRKRGVRAASLPCVGREPEFDPLLGQVGSDQRNVKVPGNI